MHTDERLDQRTHRRVVVLAAGTLAVATLSSLMPIPSVVSVASAGTSTSGVHPTDAATLDPATSAAAAGAVAGSATSRVVVAAPVAPTLRPKPVVKPKAKVAVSPYRVGTVAYAQWWAKNIMARRYGWTSPAQFRCLVNLWNRESHWNYRSHNKSSGAHGIPQALPGSKMGKIAPDWLTNPITQIRWGLGYVKGRYTTPCGAWSHFQSHNWY